MTLNAAMRVRERFARSANVERDAGGEAVREYLPTARGLDVLARIVAAMDRPSGGRAVSITGPYGSGKSSFALFLDALLGPEGDRARLVAERILNEIDAAMVGRLKAATRAMGDGPRGFIRAVVTARQEPIAQTLLRALRTGAVRYAGSEQAAKKVPALRAVLEANPDDLRGAQGILTLIRDMAAVAPVLLIIDEFGKSLEHFASSDGGVGSDIFVLQEIAEATGGDDPLPALLVTLQHLAFEEYIAGASAVQRREWSKIQGRFIDVSYVESPSQAQRLIASVFEPPVADAILRQRLERWADRAAAETVSCGLDSALHLAPGECYPLHPVTLAVLPDLCARYGQNERTLFSFLAGPEPLSVRSYLSQTEVPAAGELPSVRLDRVYDYFLESASGVVGASSSATRWLEIETRIRDTVGLSDAERRVLKTVGVLNLVSAGGALRASRAIVEFASVDGREGTSSAGDIQGILKALESHGLVTYRDFADEYRIWSGTDFDLTGAVELARRRLRDESVASLLERTRPLPPIIAARHSQQTGTLRTFERHYVDQQSGEIAPPAAASPADGLVLLCVDPSGTVPPTKQVSDTDKPILVGFSDSIIDVMEAARELGAHIDVLDTAAELEGDWVARRELRERISAATLNLDVALDRAFGSSSASIQWVRLPERAPIETVRSVSAALSSVCDQLYPDVPEIRNEMLARRNLTSQGARARRELLDAMVEHGGQEALGLEGFGPERAMYEAVLLRPGIHRFEKGSWRFGPPGDELHFGPAWLKLQAAIDEAINSKLSIAELVEQLMAPPIGLKDGPIPVLITAALLARAEDVALYEDGTFLPRLTADAIERLARNPDRFAIKCYATAGSRRDVLAALGEALGVTPGASSKVRVRNVLAVVSALLAKARNWPPYSQRTKSPNGVAQTVRAALFTAREPDELLFTTLPTACGLAALPPRGRVDAAAVQDYAQTLAAAVAELDQLYPGLLDHIEQAVAQGLVTKVEKVRQDAGLRAERIADRILEPHLRSFALALKDEHLDREDWLQHIGMLAVSKPPSSWTDDDRLRFDQQLAQLAGAFRRVESLHFAQERVPAEGFQAMRVSVTLPDGTDASRVVWLDDGADALIAETLESVVRDVSQLLGARGEETLLALLSKRILIDSEVNEAEGPPSGAVETRGDAWERSL